MTDELDIDGLLDLHLFRPEETRDLVADWLDACRERGLLEVKIVHGKGIGVQREIVQGVLRRHPGVLRFGPAHDASSWGATVATLHPLEGDA